MQEERYIYIFEYEQHQVLQQGSSPGCHHQQLPDTRRSCDKCSEVTEVMKLSHLQPASHPVSHQHRYHKHSGMLHYGTLLGLL